MQVPNWLKVLAATLGGAAATAGTQMSANGGHADHNTAIVAGIGAALALAALLTPPPAKNQ